MGGFAWVTLATNDSYSLGALVLAHSLKKVSTKYDLAVLITPGVTEVMREKLSAVFTLVKEVNVLDSKDEANLALLARPELGITFTKLHCWRLTQYDKCVFIDADALVIKNSDELFERDELSAAPDVGWPDCFNSGVFVFKPSQITFSSLTSHAKLHGSFDGGDQGLLNSFFSDWAHKDISKHLPFIYNMCSTATYSYLPAFKQFGEDVKIIHFIGSTKPWLQYFDTLTGQVQPHPDTGYLQPMLQHWWNIFCENVHPQLSPVMLSTEQRATRYCEASSTLATAHWHDLQFPVSSKPTLTRHVCHDTTTTEKKTHDEIDAVPDFTNFRDPWEYYIVSTPENPVAHSSQQIPQQTHTIQQQQISQDDVYQISQSMNNITIQHDQINTNNNENIQNQTTHDYPHYQYYNNQLQNIKHDVSVDSSSSYQQQQHEQSKPSTSRQVQSHVEYTRHNLTEQNQANDGVDETDKISKILDNDYDEIDRILNSKFINDNKQTDNNQNNKIINTISQFQNCTESNIVGSKSDMKIISNDENNAGIAGALAKITLGETRSSEQVALEEHMRKYGWEQGQIDYMGRDSFDNIWKKINTTLETSSSSSKSDKVSVKTKSGETEEKVSTKKADLSTEKSSKNIPDETKTTDAAVSSDETLEKTINEAKEILSTNIESSPGSSSEVILSVKAAPPILSIKERGENDNKMSRKQQLKISRSQEESNISDTVIPLGFTSSTEPVSIDTKLDIEKQDLPIPETSAVGDLSLESTKDTEKLDTIKLELDETKNTDFVDEKTTTIMPEDVNVIENIESKILSDEAQGQTTTDIKIPATPTIIEATPPTSPQFETTEEKEEIKAPQKIARKIIKKEKLTQDDDAIEGTSDNKTSKLVDVGKSTTDENLETDESVPETPPPPTSVNPPTPPKRKSKISTAKNTTKKNNSEQ
ncbi:glycogenin-1 isoform X2 [Aphidius gifuensis]|uniref:glycogenin-1 isoform X2 n=1 Tax=Aphidius gifuensis TaxID=684658 RepID=UPI001CDC1742|nr:glycogenin-1 isoform X2 [Aphidius gifuensis]